MSTQICRLTHLTRLDLSWNRITALPDAIGRLTNLEDLCLEFNQLTRLPNTMSLLTRLESLVLNGNPFEILPDVLLRLTSLKKLYLLDIRFCRLEEKRNMLAQLSSTLTSCRLYCNLECSRP